MTRTDTGSDDDTTSNDPQGGDGKHDNTTRILIAVIGALAAIGAAAAGAYFAQDADSKGTTDSRTGSSASVSASASASLSAEDEDSCDLRRLADSWDQPPSQRYNETLFGNRRPPHVYTQVGGPARSPEISVKGQLSLDIPAGQVLYLVTRPDPDSKDEFGHPGNGRFYPGTPISPTSGGCWEDDNHAVGYPGVEGISETYLLVLVGSDQAAKFPADRKAKGWDGYSAEDWRSITKIDVMNFHVSTA
ncbi:hypothetical protein [Streptomyces sp. NPDC091219]|uniref:hypothetical protein n=1 Tax=Streptomyces sp. NPDC091219 TaxID=3155193 RepID=UPI00344C4801